LNTTTPPLAQTVRRQRHIRFVGADDDYMVAVVGDGGRHCAGLIVSEARNEGIGDAADAAMSPDQSDLADIASGIHMHNAVGHAERSFERACRRLVLDDADDAP